MHMYKITMAATLILKKKQTDKNPSHVHTLHHITLHHIALRFIIFNLEGEVHNIADQDSS